MRDDLLPKEGGGSKKFTLLARLDMLLFPEKSSIRAAMVEGFG